MTCIHYASMWNSPLITPCHLRELSEGRTPPSQSPRPLPLFQSDISPPPLSTLSLLSSPTKISFECDNLSLRVPFMSDVKSNAHQQTHAGKKNKLRHLPLSKTNFNIQNAFIIKCLESYYSYPGTHNQRRATTTTTTDQQTPPSLISPTTSFTIPIGLRTPLLSFTEKQQRSLFNSIVQKDSLLLIHSSASTTRGFASFSRCCCLVLSALSFAKTSD